MKKTHKGKMHGSMKKEKESSAREMRKEKEIKSSRKGGFSDKVKYTGDNK